MRGFGVSVKLRISFGGNNFLEWRQGTERLNTGCTEEKSRAQRKIRGNYRREAEDAEKTEAHRQVCPPAAGRPVLQNLVCGLGGGFGAGLEQFLYFLDVGGHVNAHSVVHRLDHVHVEAVFQPAELFQLFDAF